MKMNQDKLRMIFLGVVVGIVMLGFSFRLADLQIANGQYYLERQRAGTSRTQVIKAARGEIVDRNGQPFTVNEVSYTILFDKALEPKGTTNRTILKLIHILQASGETWRDSLPLAADGTQAFSGSDEEIARLKGKNFLDLNTYATAQEVVYWLGQRYELAGYTPLEARQIAGVRYEMERQGYSLSNRFVFADDISLDTAILIRQRGDTLPGVDVVETAKRAYIEGSLAPHIIGRTGAMFAEELDYYLSQNRGYSQNDIVGKEGLEKAFESVLRGQDGLRRIYLDSSYKVEDVQVEREAVPGNTVVTTIDKDIQRAAYQALENQIKKLNETAPVGQGKEANAGAVVAVDVKTGEVLASVTYPSYDLATYSQDFTKNATDPLAPFLNRAFNGVYAPGSCFKPVTSVAGLTENIVNPTTRINCTGIYTYFSDYRPGCLHTHGMFTVIDALRHSCNIYFYDTGRQLGIARINQYASALGLGVPTGIELSESRGTQCDPNTASPGDALQAAIGQLDNGYTPLQLAQYSATLARNGDVIPLSLVKAVSSYYDYEQVVVPREPKQVKKSDIPAEVFQTVREGMTQATHDPRGTAYWYLGDYPIKIASKTGTPQTAQFPNSTFICYAPADDPQIAIAVVIEKGWHGYTGAPVARAVFDQYFFPEKQLAQQAQEEQEEQEEQEAQQPLEQTDQSAESEAMQP